jgi:mannose-6-phosphate isomerase-like protein (cupin superfamily)
MPVIRSAEGVAHDMHGTVFTAYANSTTGTAELCAWSTRIPAGGPGMPHRISREEIFLVTSGTPRFTIDDESIEAQSGDVVVAPADALLTIEALGDQDLTIWVTTSRGLTAKPEDGSEFAPPWAQ